MKKEMLKAAFDKTGEALAELQRVRAIIAELHYKAEEVDNSKFLLENVGKWAAPSDDAHEILFERVKLAEKRLDDALAGEPLMAVHACLLVAEKAVQEAKQSADSTKN